MRQFHLSFITLLVLLPCAAKADTPEYIFNAARNVNPLALMNRVDCTEERIEGPDGGIVLRIKPDRDPYANVQWRFRFDGTVPWPEDGAVVEFRFRDRGAGLIQPRLRTADGWTGPTRQVSYTRLNTEQWRSAFFHFDNPPATEGLGDHLTVEGLQYLHEVCLWPPFTDTQWAELRESVPTDVEPMVALERPAILTTTAGVDVRGGLDALDNSLDAMHELAPLARVLGFTSIESYVTWKRIEPAEEGTFDFGFYDAIVDKLQQYDLKWHPLLIVGSAYALPQWFADSEENIGFVCLEHGEENPIQSIWSPYHKRHVERVLKAFGEHYDGKGVLDAVRLGPSGNYGESQYPAGGNWGFQGEPMHIHIGWWGGDEHAIKDFRETMRKRYGDIHTLNDAWHAEFASFEDVAPVLPEHIYWKQRRLDVTAWYTDNMSEWCAWWAGVARDAMPDTVLYQSAGGWGFRESGTDYTHQTKSMIAVNGGIRLTNETDSFDQNFYATRLAATAARHYDVRLGYEPASSHTARGVAGRLFNTVTTNGDHFFTYQNNIFYDQYAIDQWLEYLPLMDRRQEPIVDVAVYYPETFNQLDDSAFRHLYAWGFNPRAREVRNVVEVDYLDERLIREGFLDQYRVLVFAWGNIVEPDVLAMMDKWLRDGGTIVYTSFPKGPLQTIGGDTATFQKWEGGDTGNGTFHRFQGDMEPPKLYGNFVESVLKNTETLHPWTRSVLRAGHPSMVYFSIQQDGHVMVLNYNSEPATVTLAPERQLTIAPYGIAREKLE